MARDQAEIAQHMAGNRRISEEFDDQQIHKYDRPTTQSLDEQNRLRDEEVDYEKRHKHDNDNPEGDIAKEDKIHMERIEDQKQDISDRDNERTIEPEIERKPDLDRE